MRYLTILLLCLFCTSSGNSQISNSAQISLLTCDSGDELYSVFGHSALRIQDKANNVDQVFNYGVFDFNTPGFYIKFMRGLLPYKLGTGRYENFVRQYQYEERSIDEQVLNLSEAEKSNIVKALQENLKPENIYYKYDFFFDNCSTRLNDLLNEGVNGERTFQNDLKTITYRGMLKEQLKSMPWSDFGIDLVIGARADKITSRKTQMFLPLYLFNHTGASRIVKDTIDKPLVLRTDTILEYSEAKQRRKQVPLFTPLLLFGIIFLLELLLFQKARTGHWRKAIRYYDAFWFVVMGMLGLFMLFMAYGTEHIATKENWNVLWASPLYVIPGIYILKGRYPEWSSTMLKVLMGVLVLCILNAIIQFFPQYYNKAFILIILITWIKSFRYLKRAEGVSNAS